MRKRVQLRAGHAAAASCSESSCDTSQVLMSEEGTEGAPQQHQGARSNRATRYRAVQPLDRTVSSHLLEDTELQVSLATLKPGNHRGTFLLMEDPEKKLNQKSDGKPRKVRFKISSSYSGRVLKQVFEDGQELESPKEEYPHSFLQESLEPMDGVYGSGEAPKPQPYSPKLTAQRISVFREGSAYTLAGGQPFFNDYKANDHKSPPIIDFGKIIIYTNNLKIIRTPMDKRDFMKKILQKEEEAEEESLMSKEEIYGNSDQNDRPLPETDSTFPHNQYPQEGELPEDNCFHCRGSGSATCSLCHGSKFSMLANRFKESYRALRCPACNENGLQPCQICNQ